MVIAHGLHVLQSTQAAHHDVVLPVRQIDLIQVTVGTNAVQHAIQIAGQSHQEIIDFHHGQQRAVAGVHLIEVGAAVVVIQNSRIHQTGGVIVGHIRGIDTGRIAQLDDLAGRTVIAPVLAALGIAVEAAVVAIEIASNEVNGRYFFQCIGNAVQVYIDHVAVVIITGIVVVGVEVAVHIHNSDHALDQDVAGGSGNDCIALRNRSHIALCVHNSHGFVRGSPDQILDLIVPGDGVSLQLGVITNIHNQTVLLHPQRFQRLSVGDLVVGFSQSVQSHDLSHGVVLDQAAGSIICVGGIRIALGSHISNVNADQLGTHAAPGAGVVCPVQDAVTIGQGLRVIGIQIGTVRIGQGDHIALGIGQCHRLIGFIQNKDIVLCVLNGVQRAVIVIRNGVRCVVVITVVTQNGQLAAQQIHGAQVDIVVSLCQDIHGIGGIIEGHVQNVHTQIAQGSTVPQAGGQHDQIVHSIHSKNLAADIFRCVNSRIFHVVIGMDGDQGILACGNRLVHRDPAIHMITVEMIIKHTITVQLGGIHIRQILTGEAVIVGQLKVGFIACVVTQHDHEFLAQIRYIDLDTIQAVDQLGKDRLLCPGLGAALVHDEHIGQGHIFCNQQHQLVAVVGVLHIQLQVGCLGIHSNGDLEGMVTAVGIVHLSRDSQQNLGVILQVLAFRIGKVIHAVAVPGIQPGNNLTIGALVHSLSCIGNDLFAQHLAGFSIGVGKGQGLGITHQRDVHLIQSVHNTVTVGRDHVVGRIVNHVAVFIHGRTGVGVKAQHPVSTSQAGPHDMVILVALGNSVNRSHAPEAVVIPISGIEHRGLGPVAVEAQERQVQAGIVQAVQIDIAFHIAAVGIVFRKECLIFLGQVDGDIHGSGAIGRNDHFTGAEGDRAGQCGLHAIHVVVVAIACHSFGQQAGIQRVALFLIAEVMDLKAEAESAVSAVAHFCLGLAAVNSQVALSGDCSSCVHQAGALLAGRSFQTGVGRNNNFSIAHHQSIGHFSQLALGSVGEPLMQILHDQSRHTGHLGSRHGGTGHQTVSTTIIAGVDIAANTGNIGFQAQIGSSAPAGEVAHLTAGCAGTLTGQCGDGQDLLFRVGHHLAIRDSDQSSGNPGIVLAILGDLHTEGKNIVFSIVPDQSGNRAGILCVKDLGSKAGGTTADHSNLALDQGVALFVIEVSFLTHAVDDHILEGITVILDDLGQSDLVQIGIHIEHLVIAHGEIRGHNNGIFHGSHGGGVSISTGRSDRCHIGVFGGIHIGTPHIAVGAGTFVACRNADDHILLSNTLINSINFLVLRGEACRRAQRQVRDITAQGHCVFQSRNDVIGISAAVGAKDLHDDQLCFGSHTHHVSTGNIVVCCCNTGNVGTVVALHIRTVVSGQALVNIVERIGNLCAAVQRLANDRAAQIMGIQILQHCIDLLNSQRTVGQNEIIMLCERGMIQIQTGIDDSDLHAFAVIAQVFPNTGNTGHHTAGSSGGGRSGAGGVHRHQVDALNTVHRCDLIQIAKLGLNRERIGQIGKLVTDIQLLTLQNELFDHADDHVLHFNESFLIEYRNQADGAVNLGQRLILHNNESGNHIALAIGFCGFLQLLQSIGSFVERQGSVRQLALGRGYDPLAVHIHQLSFLHIGNVTGVVTQVLSTGSILRYNTVILKGRSLGFGCNTFFSVLYADQAVFRSFHSESGRNSRQDHRQNQKHCQQAFASHFVLPPR